MKYVTAFKTFPILPYIACSYHGLYYFNAHFLPYQLEHINGVIDSLMERNHVIHLDQYFCHSVYDGHGSGRLCLMDFLSLGWAIFSRSPLHSWIKWILEDHQCTYHVESSILSNFRAGASMQKNFYKITQSAAIVSYFRFSVVLRSACFAFFLECIVWIIWSRPSQPFSNSNCVWQSTFRAIVPLVLMLLRV